MSAVKDVRVKKEHRTPLSSAGLVAMTHAISDMSSPAGDGGVEPEPFSHKLLKHETRTRGFTLIELMISITLVAAIATGMMMTLHTSLLSLEKIDSRLQLNRRVMGMEKILNNQISGVMPVVSDCGDKHIPIFLGTSDSLRLVTSYSMDAGARGYPQFDVFQVVRGDQGVRLVVTEHPYTGPSSTASLCSSTQVTPSSIIVADRLASCTFSYREALPDQPPLSKWLPGWDNPNLLPAAVKIEMTQLDSSPALLPVVNVTVPIRITREMRAIYADQ